MLQDHGRHCTAQAVLAAAAAPPGESIDNKTLRRWPDIGHEVLNFDPPSGRKSVIRSTTSSRTIRRSPCDKKFQQINRFSIFIDFIDTWRVRLISHFAVGLFSLSMSPVELDTLLWDLTLLFLSVYCRTFSYHVYLFRQLLDSQVASLRPFVCFFLMRVLYLAYYIVWHNKRVVIVLIVVLLHNK